MVSLSLSISMTVMAVERLTMSVELWDSVNVRRCLGLWFGNNGFWQYLVSCNHCIAVWHTTHHTHTHTRSDFESCSAHRTRNRVRPFELGRLIESLLIARLLKSEDTLSEAMVRSMSFLVGSDEAMHLVWPWYNFCSMFQVLSTSSKKNSCPNWIS